jgi:riboflavin synthase
MFSGIIYCTGRVKAARPSGKGKIIEILLSKEIINPEKGMSIAVNGACLTAISFAGAVRFTADVSAETLLKTTLKNIKPGKYVNIEFPLTADKFLSGHIVQGHVDAEGKVESLKKEKGDTLLAISYPKEFDKYVVEKGSITVDGISLTAFNLKPGKFSVAVIPETLKNTTLGGYKPGDAVNLEFDVIGKYVEKQLSKKRD